MAHGRGHLQACRGLGGGAGQPLLAAAAFDVQQPVRVYGATITGRLLQLNLGNAKTFQGCRVRAVVAAV